MVIGGGACGDRGPRPGARTRARGSEGTGRARARARARAAHLLLDRQVRLVHLAEDAEAIGEVGVRAEGAERALDRALEAGDRRVLSMEASIVGAALGEPVEHFEDTLRLARALLHLHVQLHELDERCPELAELRDGRPLVDGVGEDERRGEVAARATDHFVRVAHEREHLGTRLHRRGVVDAHGRRAWNGGGALGTTFDFLAQDSGGSTSGR